MSNSSKVSSSTCPCTCSAFFSVLTPRDYLEKYCRVNNRRYTLYKRVFDKHKDSEGELSLTVSEDVSCERDRLFESCLDASRCSGRCLHENDRHAFHQSSDPSVGLAEQCEDLLRTISRHRRLLRTLLLQYLHVCSARSFPLSLPRTFFF